MQIMTQNTCAAILFLFSTSAIGQSTTSVQYLANEGLMVTHEETKVLFDPLYTNSYGQYQLVPAAMRDAIFAGEAPYDDVDAVFVSHHHGDHFSAEEILRLLRSQTSTKLYAPAQAVSAIRDIANADDEQVLERLVGLDLDYGDAPVSIRAEGIIVDAVHIPHSGWPTARTDVQNIAFRVTLDDNSTVLHLGDADPRTVHFESDEEYWEERTVDLAFPPYWWFMSEDGLELLDNRIDVTHSIGIHVPDEFRNQASIPAELLGQELFTNPGEGRRFTGSQ
jgi:L-ascorbate metabolism protein UlaG (beta-lactamase superfamily)